MLDRKIKRQGKIDDLIKKLGQDKYYWAFEVQCRNFPFWNEAFDYAYQLGLERGRNEGKNNPNKGE